MSHAYLYIYGNQLKREEKISQFVAEKANFKKLDLSNHPDIFNIRGDNSISIGQIRELKRKVQRKPYSLPQKFALIWEAEKLTLPAQNSLLKLLEEPPQNTIIILSCQNEDLLLPTIVSRCQTVKLLVKRGETEDKLKESFLTLKKIITAKIGGRFKEAEVLSKKREEAVKFLENSILIFRDLIHQRLAVKKKSHFLKPPFKKLTIKELTYQIKSFQKTRDLIKKNINTRLALENLFLKIPKVSS